MPYPAITVNDVEAATTSARDEYRTSTGQKVSTTVLNFSHMVGSATTLSKPATTVNPKRDDGTRKMSAYATDWCSMPPIPRRGGLRKAIGSYHYLYPDYPVVNVLRAKPGPMFRLLQEIPALDKLVCDAEARTRTLNKVSQKKWDLGVTAVEFKQTAGLVVDLAQGMTKTVVDTITAHRRSEQALYRFFADVRRQGDFSKAAHSVGLTDIGLLNNVRDRWMQYQFGVRPLVRDIYDSSAALAHHLYKDGYKILVRAKSGAEKKSDARLVSIGTQDPQPKYTLIGETTVQDHYSVVYEVPTGTTGFQNELGLDNPAALLWEATRLSWMFDYVISAGAWLQSLTATRHMVFREGCHSHLERLVTWQARCEGINHITGLLQANYASNTGRFTRTLIPSSGLIPAAMPVPRSELGLLQLGNSLFALSSVFSGKSGLR